MDSIVAWLEHNGYSRSSTVREPGEYAVRGGILDLFPAGLDLPVRFDFFGDSLESIRSFDAETQRTMLDIRGLDLVPVSEFQLVTETIRRELEVSESRSRALAESLHESESYYRTVVEQQGDGVLAVNPEETITFANPAAEAIFGVPPGTLTGRNLKEFVQQDDFVLIQSQTRRRAEGRRDVYELVILQPSGQRVTLW